MYYISMIVFYFKFFIVRLKIPSKTPPMDFLLLPTDASFYDFSDDLSLCVVSRF